MSAPHRPFFLRFTLAMLGTVLLMAVLFVGLGWVVWAHMDWVRKIVGQEKAFRLSDWYMARMMDVLPGDRDGDGACDGAEVFWNSDPQNPWNTPLFHPYCISRPSIIGYCGERLTTRWGHDLINGLQPWPRGFRAVVTADEPVLLLKDAVGPPTKGPLVVTANARGEVEFDMLAESVFWDAHVEFDNSAGSLGGRGFCRFPGWRTPMPVSIKGGPPSEPLNLVEDLQQRIETG